MKKLILLLVAIATISLSSFGQAPEGFKYQAVVRDAGNIILNNQLVGMRMTIQQGSMGGTTVYQETFAPTTNAYGLVNLEIGSGTVVNGDFTIVDWSAGPYFIETAIDVTGGTSYIVMGTSQLMSVPYALYAKTSGNGQGPVGPAGADGIDGTTGPMGPQGPAGLNGADGIDGLDGVTGPMGLQGPAGLNGLDGIDGLDGATGPQGLAGLNGADGIDGLDGATGAMGPQGPAGLNGADGIDGATGPAGAGFVDGDNAGDMIYWNGTAWVIVATTPNEGATLQMIGGVPTWVGGTAPSVNGQQEYTTPGSFTWTAPAGVTSVCVVAIGGGGGGGRSSNTGQTPGGDSYFINAATVRGGGGGHGINAFGTFTGNGGGNGGYSNTTGSSFSGGGGAGGYSGSGGYGGIGDGSGTVQVAGSNGTGGGGGGGGWGSGGGVGIYGEGANGSGAPIGAATGGGGGSGGVNGTNYTALPSNNPLIQRGGLFGGGGGSTYFYGGSGGGLGWTNNITVVPGNTYTVVVGNGGLPDIQWDYAGQGGSGAVRIIWGTGRAFPSTNTIDL